MKYDVNKIKLARAKRGWSQTQLARAIGKSSATISLIESGNMGGMPGTIKAIADVLNIPMEDLVIEKSA